MGFLYIMVFFTYFNTRTAYWTLRGKEGEANIDNISVRAVQQCEPLLAAGLWYRTPVFTGSGSCFSNGNP